MQLFGSLDLLMQALNIIFLGDKSGKGTFFPEGVFGKIKTGEGFDELASGTENFPIWPKKAPQVLSSCMHVLICWYACKQDACSKF